MSRKLYSGGMKSNVQIGRKRKRLTQKSLAVNQGRSDKDLLSML